MTPRDRIQEFIVKLLTHKASIPPGDLDSFRYLDYGQVDSLGLIQFILEIEEQFGIEFTPEETQSDAFRTVGGLVALVGRKINCT